MKPYQQSERQIGAMPQPDRKDRMVSIFCAIATLIAVCLWIGEPGETPAPVQIASK